VTGIDLVRYQNHDAKAILGPLQCDIQSVPRLKSLNAQRSPLADHDLVAHQSMPSLPRHRMLDLNAFIHLEEKELAVLSTMNSTVPALV